MSNFTSHDSLLCLIIKSTMIRKKKLKEWQKQQGVGKGNNMELLGDDYKQTPMDVETDSTGKQDDTYPVSRASLYSSRVQEGSPRRVVDTLLK